MSSTFFSGKTLMIFILAAVAAVRPRATACFPSTVHATTGCMSNRPGNTGTFVANERGRIFAAVAATGSAQIAANGVFSRASGISAPAGGVLVPGKIIFVPTKTLLVPARTPLVPAKAFLVPAKTPHVPTKVMFVPAGTLLAFAEFSLVRAVA